MPRQNWAVGLIWNIVLVICPCGEPLPLDAGHINLLNIDPLHSMDPFEQREKIEPHGSVFSDVLCVLFANEL